MSWQMRSFSARSITLTEPCGAESSGGHGLSVKSPREGLSLRDLIHRKLLYQWSGSEHCEQLRHERLQAARVDTRFGGDPSEWAGLLLDR